MNALAPAVDTPGVDLLREFLGPDLVFLAGGGAGFITGQLIAVDGGLTMLGGWLRILFLLLVADSSGCDVDAQPVLWKSTIRRREPHSHMCGWNGSS